MSNNSNRIDKYLWSVRIYKTRSKATEACKKGKVSIEGQIVKPAREVKEGDIIKVDLKQFTKTIKVIQLLNNRVSARLVENYMEELTPEEEYNKQKKMRELNYEYRDRGAGRPTKKERRLIDRLKKNRF